MIRKLQRKFIAIAMLSVVLVLSLMIGAINVTNYRTMVKEADDTLLLLAFNDGKFPVQFEGEKPDSAKKHDDFDNKGRERAFSAELPFQARFFTVSFAADGTITDCNVDRITLSEEEATALAEEAYTQSKQVGFLHAFRYRKELLPSGTTNVILLNCERELATFRSFLLVSVGISTGGTLAVFLLIVLFSGRVIRPIAQSYEKQKSFITDAGHELKTPITIINADVDVLETEIEQSEWLSDIRTQTQRLADLTNDLIYLSKMEEDNVSLQMIEFPLSDVASEMVQSFSAIARAKGKTFDSAIMPMVTMKGDEKAVQKLLSILLDNAMKYSTPSGVIRFSLARSAKQITISVYNTAEGIEKGSNDRLFDRFYRTDQSRNSATGGFGLGLAVAKAVTEAHHGSIHAYSQDGASLTVETTFPET